MTQIGTKESEIFNLLKEVKDPEVPVLDITDLGVLRKVDLEDGLVEVTITPTYSGCPAMEMIEQEIIACLNNHGYPDVKVTTVLSPAWTTDWMSEEGKTKLKAYGIAPPEKATEDKSSIFPERKKIECPQCNSKNTEMISQFGSTACKALYKCLDCKEPFDYFKCL